MKWNAAKGFESRRTEFVAQCGGIVYRVSSKERINGNFVSSRFYHAYMDNDYLGYAATADGAKLICVLNHMEYAQ